VKPEYDEQYICVCVRLCSRYVVVTKALETAGCRYFRQRVATEHGIWKLETSSEDNNRVFDSNTITTTTNDAAGPAFSMLVHELQRRRTQNDGKRYADICKKNCSLYTLLTATYQQEGQHPLTGQRAPPISGGTYRRRRALIDGYLESPFPTACLL